MYTQKELLEELMVSGAEMEALLRDSYANYVIQTCVCIFQPLQCATQANTNIARACSRGLQDTALADHLSSSAEHS